MCFKLASLEYTTPKKRQFTQDLLCFFSYIIRVPLITTIAISALFDSVQDGCPISHQHHIASELNCDTPPSCQFVCSLQQLLQSLETTLDVLPGVATGERSDGELEDKDHVWRFAMSSVQHNILQREFKREELKQW